MINWVRVITLAIMALVPVSSRAEGTGGGTEAPLNLLNPRITVFGNATLRVDDRPVTLYEEPDESELDDRFNLRETEFDMRGAVDPFADGVFILTLESKVPGEFEPGIEEGYVTIKALPWFERMPLGLKFRVGRFRSAIGQLNIVHTHDLPQTTRPLVVRSFLGEEGVIVDGGSAQMLFPLPLEEVSIGASASAFSSGDSLESGTPGYSGRIEVFAAPSAEHSVTIGGSGLGDRQDDEIRAVLGADATYKWKPLRGGEWSSVLFGTEVFRAAGRALEERPSNDRSRWGYYAFAQYQWNRSLYTGVRWDSVEHIANCGPFGWLDGSDQSGLAQGSRRIVFRRNCTDVGEIYLEHQDDDLWDGDTLRQVTPYATYYFSEFLRFRASWERTWKLGYPYNPYLDRKYDDTFWLELNIVVGSHPPEPYWVNR